MIQGESDQTPFEVLKTKVYPVINDVILKVPQRSLSSSTTSSNRKKLRSTKKG